MDNVPSSAILAIVAIVAACLLGAFIFTTVQSQKESGNQAEAQTETMTAALDESQFTQYDGEELTGRQVKSIIKSMKGTQTAAEIIYKTASGSKKDDLYYDIDGTADTGYTLGTEKDEGSVSKYANEILENTSIYSANVIRDNETGAIIAIQFVQNGADGSIADVAEADEASETEENTVLGKSYFQAFAAANNPTAIIFTTSGTSTGEDVSEAQDGCTLAWMDGSTMYVSCKKAGQKVKAPADCSKLFCSGSTSGWQSGLNTIDCSALDTSNVTDMSSMFEGCYKLTSVDVRGFDTHNVTNMRAMFEGCHKLTSVDVRGFDTHNVTDMAGMFNVCKNLAYIDVSNFDTHNVTNMRAMFEGCSSITSLDVSSFDTSNVTDMSYMFCVCLALESIDLSNFDTSNVTTMLQMFEYCYALKSVDTSCFDTSNVTNMKFMFDRCKSLTHIDVSRFNTSNVTDMSYMFNTCQSLETIDVSSFNTSNVTDMRCMFNLCQSLKTLDISNFDMNKVNDVYCICDYDNTSLRTFTIPATNGNGISNTTSKIYGSSSSVSATISASGRTVTLK